MVDVVVYVSSVANAVKHPRKVECLEAFAQGVRAAGATVTTEYTNRYISSRLAVILGWATPTSTGGRNIALRKQIIDEQKRQGKHTMCIDASCFKYLDNHGSYLRYSIGGPFYDRAEYANADSSGDKWNRISRELGIQLKPYRPPTDSGHILICMQRDGGFAMKNLNPMVWLNEKIHQIRKHTNRFIIVRPHPGQFNMNDFAIYQGKHARRLNVHVQHPERSRLVDDVQNAHAAVMFNSSSSVAALCEGVPVFVDDHSAVSWSVANTDIAQIETPQLFDRNQWMWNLSSAHWSDAEGRAGDIYRKFLPFL